MTTETTQPRKRRRDQPITAKQVKVVKIAQRQLTWSEDEYQAVLEQVGVAAGDDGRRSCKDMTQGQFDSYVRHAQACGFDPAFGAVPPSNHPSKAQMFRLYQLKNELISARAGCRVGSDVRSGDRLCTTKPDTPRNQNAVQYAEGIIAQATRGRPQTWWTPYDASRAIEALQRVLARVAGCGTNTQTH